MSVFILRLRHLPKTHLRYSSAASAVYKRQAHDSARVGAGCAYIWVPCACGRIHTRACACQFHKQYHKQHCSPGVSSELRGTHMLTRTLLSPLVAHAITETKEASPHQPTRCTCSRQVPCTAEAGMPAGACVLAGVGASALVRGTSPHSHPTSITDPSSSSRPCRPQRLCAGSRAEHMCSA